MHNVEAFTLVFIKLFYLLAVRIFVLALYNCAILYVAPNNQFSLKNQFIYFGSPCTGTVVQELYHLFHERYINNSSLLSLYVYLHLCSGQSHAGCV